MKKIKSWKSFNESMYVDQEGNLKERSTDIDPSHQGVDEIIDSDNKEKDCVCILYVLKGKDTILNNEINIVETDHPDFKNKVYFNIMISSMEENSTPCFSWVPKNLIDHIEGSGYELNSGSFEDNRLKSAILYYKESLI